MKYIHRTENIKLTYWIGAWLSLIDSLVFILTLGHYQTKFQFIWHFRRLSKEIDNG